MGWPKSYLLELVALHAYQCESSSVDAGFALVLNLLQRPELKLAWSRWYDAGKALKQQCFQGEPQIILDPANPTNNVARSVKNWTALKDHAAQTQGAMKAVTSCMKTAFTSLRQQIVNLEAQIEELEPLAAYARRSSRRMELQISKEMAS